MSEKKKPIARIFEDLLSIGEPDIKMSEAREDIALMLSRAKYFSIDFIFEDHSAIHVERTPRGLGSNVIDNLDEEYEKEKAEAEGYGEWSPQGGEA